jgi:hypothetical protein
MLRSSSLLAVIASAVLGLAPLSSPASARGGGHSGASGSLHGPGSTHDPIIYHPVHGPGSTHNPILATKPIVRDHRDHGGAHGGGPNGGAPSSEGGVTVTSGSGRNKVVVPTHLRDYPVYAIPGNGLYNGPSPFAPIVRDHR